MTMDFSQRMGFTSSTKAAQIDGIDNELRNSLWNVLVINLYSKFSPEYTFASDLLKGSNFYRYAENLYLSFYKIPVDTVPQKWSELRQLIRNYFFEAEWHRIYSFLEFNVQTFQGGIGKILRTELNNVLERENSGYRFVSDKLTPITSREEIEEVESAIDSSDRYTGVKTHLQTALGLMTDRENPDYRNSIKESISAVESFAKKLVGNDKATLGQALKILEEKHNLHASLKSAFMTLYGYTSDAGGIRHAILDNTVTPTKADARFMLICCSAFINFAIDSIEN